MAKKIKGFYFDGFASAQKSNSWIAEAQKYKDLSKDNPVKITQVNVAVQMSDELKELYKEFYALKKDREAAYSDPKIQYRIKELRKQIDKLEGKK